MGTAADPAAGAAARPRARLPEPRTPRALAALVPAALLLWVLLFAGWTFDDSYIAYRFAEHWSEGSGLVWNPGEDPVEGFTSFLWVALAAGLRALTGVAPQVAMPLVGAACWLLLAGWVAPAAFRRSGAEGGVAAAVTAVVVLNPYLGFHALHGLETALHALMLGSMAALTPAAVQGRRLGALAALGVAAFTVRPDAVAYVAPLWVVLAVHAAGHGRSGRVLGWALLGLTLPVAAYTLARWAYFGWPLPNTVYVKSADPMAGIGYVARWVGMTSPLWAAIAIAGALGRRRVWGDPRFLALAVPTISLTLAYARFSPTMGLGYRFLAPTLVPLAATAVCAWTLVPAPERRQASLVVSAAAAAVVALFGARMAFQYDYLQAYFAGIDRVLVDAGRRLAPAADFDRPPLLATGDVGAVPYFSGLPTLDLIGLCDERVAHQGLTAQYVAERRPDLLLLQDLYLAPAGEARPGAPVLYVEGLPRALDLAAYEPLVADPARAHTGAVSTWTIVTMPGFGDRYRWVAARDFSGGDRYHWFVRADSRDAQALAELLTRAD